MTHPPSLPPPSVCERARLTKDRRFDGLFFTAVRSTHVYCRPVCPAPTPKPENITYFSSAAAAEQCGYRPCLRCRPELSPALGRPSDDTVRRALALIGEGWFQHGTVATLASAVGVGARHLHRLFVSHTGSGPLAHHATRRLLLAKQLLSETSLSMAQVAEAAGFDSVRRFNAAFQTSYALTPTQVRRRPASAPDGVIVLRLAYRPPFDWQMALAELRHYELIGIERVDDGFTRSVGTAHRPIWIRVTKAPVADELQLHIFGSQPTDLQGLVATTRRMFDLDADLHSVHAVLRVDPNLAPAVRAWQGLRLVGGWSGLEVAIGALISRYPRDPLATLALRRLLDSGTARCAAAPPGLDRLFPTADVLAVMGLDHLELSADATQMVRRLAVACRDKRIRFDAGQNTPHFAQELVQATGAANWQAQTIALRALCEPDAAPLQARQLAGDHAASSRRPWRSYASLYATLQRERDHRPLAA